MRLKFIELLPDYNNYIFPYKVHCHIEKGDSLNDVYDMGFLLASTSSKRNRDCFYLARSVRINLSSFKDASENLRVDRKVQSLNIKVEICNKEKLNKKKLIDFCLNYAKERVDKISSKRIQSMLKRNSLKDIIVFSLDKDIIGYVFAPMDKKIIHYWFAAFDTKYMKDYSIGKWLMWKVIHLAQERKMDYVYLGTCYGDKSLYKIRDFKGIEFFDGESWNKDIKTLKRLCYK